MARALDENALNIYTDGSSFQTPRRGGVGVRFVSVDDQGEEQTIDWSPPGFRSATNNQMELKACTLALQEAKRRDLARGLNRIVIHTDSTYVRDNCRKAMFEWPKRRWHRRTGAPVLNTELWKELVKAIRWAGYRVDIEWVKGHSKDPHNRAADKSAKKSAKSAVQPALSQVSVRRKKSSEQIAPGSVGLTGQRLSVRIITCEFLRTQRVWKLMYEVVSKASPYRGKVDLIYSDELLKDGHSYWVRVNDDASNPRIVKVFRELVK